MSKGVYAKAMEVFKLGTYILKLLQIAPFLSHGDLPKWGLPRPKTKPVI